MITNRSFQLVDYIFSEDLEGGLSGLAKWFRTLDRADLAVKTGVTPTVFKLKRLTRAQSISIGLVAGQELTAKQENDVIACGLKGIENWNGAFSLAGTGDRERVSEDTLNELYALKLFNELAFVIVHISGLSPLD